MRINQDHLCSVTNKLKAGYALSAAECGTLTAILETLMVSPGQSNVVVISADVSAINGMTKALVNTAADHDVDLWTANNDTPPAIIPWWEEEGMKSSDWQFNRIDLYTKER